MKKKILAMTLLLAIVASMLAFVSCVDDEEYEAIKVKMVLLNPYTGEPVNSKTVIEVPPENTPLVWQVVVMETGEVLTDEDLPGTTLAESIRIGMFISMLYMKTCVENIEYLRMEIGLLSPGITLLGHHLIVYPKDLVIRKNGSVNTDWVLVDQV